MTDTSEAKWTPGPFRVVKRYNRTGIRSLSVDTNRPSGGVWRMDRTPGAGFTAEHIATAHLFAAAPELYESLADTLALAELKYSDTNETARICFTQARAALSNARGEAA